MALPASASPAASEPGACAGGGLITLSTAAGRCRVCGGEGDSSPGASRAGLGRSLARPESGESGATLLSTRPRAWLSARLRHRPSSAAAGTRALQTAGRKPRPLPKSRLLCAVPVGKVVRGGQDRRGRHWASTGSGLIGEAQRTNRQGVARAAPGQASGPSKRSPQIRGRFLEDMQGFCASFCHAIALLSVQTPRTAELAPLTATAAFHAASAAAGCLYLAKLPAPRACRGCAGARVLAGASTALSSPVQHVDTGGLRTDSQGSCLGAAELLRAVITAPSLQSQRTQSTRASHTRLQKLADLPIVAAATRMWGKINKICSTEMSTACIERLRDARAPPEPAARAAAEVDTHDAQGQRQRCSPTRQCRRQDLVSLSCSRRAAQCLQKIVLLPKHRTVRRYATGREKLCSRLCCQGREAPAWCSRLATACGIDPKP